MERIIPSETKLKEEIVLERIDRHRRECYKELAKLNARVKELKEQLKEHNEAIAELMIEQGLDTIELEDIEIRAIKANTYKRLIGIKAMEEKFPEVLELHPDIVTEVNVSPYIRIKLT